MKGFARREFQLVLLRRMADYQPDLVAGAVRALGSSRTEMREVNARWQRIVRSRTFPPGRRRHEAVLGPPAGTREQRIGDAVCEAAWWPPFALWPDLRFEILVGPGGSVLHEWLVRPDDAAVPQVRGVGDLEPWCCVVGDLERWFGDVRHHPGEVPSRWHAGFTTADGESYVAHFVWGLLQQVVSVG
ncbi:hypothetical protein ABZ801_05620 [Actinomadura sp. NPDC047616]|uniref:hypothetical protein n=1 Tax=Actinomadura sp. NPDC047616 TaxID=3155914 RepID=UPI0033EAF6A0